MNTHKPFTRTAIAALSAGTLPSGGPVAVMSAEIRDNGDGWYQLLPAGRFKARDGRPFDVPGGEWLMDELAFQFIRASFENRQQPVVVDYNHQTLHKDHTGSEAIAAGWISSADAMKFDPEQGLLIRPVLTSRAQAHIAALEFCYLSAVFHYDADTGRPFELRMVALTNDPGITGMQALTALSALTTSFSSETTESTVNELFKQLLLKLGVAVPDGGDPTPEQRTAALSALDSLLASQQKKGELETQVAALSAQLQTTSNAVDLTQYVPVTTYDAVRGELAALSAQHGALTADKVLEDARAAGKFFAAEEDYLRQIGSQQGVAALSAMLEKRPAIPALTRTQETLADKPQGAVALSAEDLAVIASTGISQDDFIKTRQEEQR